MSLDDMHSRRRLLWRVACFRDADYQARVWVQGVMPRAGYYDDIDDAIEDFFDALERPAGTSLKDDIGVIFENMAEATAVEALRRALEVVLELPEDERAPVQERAAQLLASPDWPAVLCAANEAGRVLGVPAGTDLLT